MKNTHWGKEGHMEVTGVEGHGHEDGVRCAEEQEEGHVSTMLAAGTPGVQ